MAASVLDGANGDHLATASYAVDSTDYASLQGSTHARSEEEEEEEDIEPHLKHTKLSAGFATLYRNGDSSSALLASGDTLIAGTHNGNINALSIPSLETIRQYHAHSASITDISASPYSSVISYTSQRFKKVPETERPVTPLSTTSKSVPTQGSPTPARSNTTSIPSSQLYIGTSSIDGHVCVSSLANAKDVVLRNFARPVQTLALSPGYQYDRTYISGGAAGNLVLTTGGRQGVSSDATTNSTAAAASGWLGSMGLSASSGKDVTLHSGEGKISIIRWSLTGKFVAWVNESGIKVMRSHLYQDSSGSDTTWKRFGHINVPKRAGWDDIASVAKARAQWIDEQCLELDEEREPVQSPEIGSPSSKSNITPGKLKKARERLLIGWADTVWIIHVMEELPKAGRPTLPGKAIMSHMFNFPDGILSGLNLYTSKLLLVLIYRTRNDDGQPLTITEENTPRKGIRRRQNGLPPELRLIDLEDENNEIEVRPLNVNRYETLSSPDYHISSVFLPPNKTVNKGRGAFSALSDGLWDIGVNATKLFNSGASVLSSSSGDDRTVAVDMGPSTPRTTSKGLVTSCHPNFDAAGQKIFVASPFECVLAVRRDIADRFQWLIEQKAFETAWKLLNGHPEIAPVSESINNSSNIATVGTLIKERPDSSSGDDLSMKTITSAEGPKHTVLDRERERLGNLWIKHLVSLADWHSAGDVAGKVLESSASWERWTRRFIEAQKFDEIAYQLPTTPLYPPISSSVYNDILGHYLENNKQRMKDLLMQWHPDVLNVTQAIRQVQTSFESLGAAAKESKDGDWLFCQDSLALLYLADGRPSNAIECFISTRNADAVVSLINEHNLLNTISDKVYDFALLRVSSELLATASLPRLDELTSEPILLLASAATQDIIPVGAVVDQFQAHPVAGDFLLYFYFRTLWRGSLPPVADDSVSAKIQLPSRPRFKPTEPVTTSKTRHLLAPFGDLAIDLFAEYAREILSDLLRSGDSMMTSTEDQGIPYNYDHAVAVCEARHYIPELVHLLALTGQARRALTLIIDELGDVAQAIRFVRDVADDALWRDLSDSCLNKPQLIKGLLENIDIDISNERSGIDPNDFVKRIPDQLAVHGLRDALARVIRENNIQHSVATGATQVLRNEVAVILASLQRGRAEGMLFEAASAEDNAGQCVNCSTAFAPFEQQGDTSDDALVGYSCGHRYHLLCLLDALTTIDNKAQVDRARRQLAQSYMDERDYGTITGRVSIKMTRVRIVAGLIEGATCVACRHLAVETVSAGAIDGE